jgi:NitT/TauT family transport system substrate-binding protein
VVAQSIPKGAYVFLSAQQARPSLEALYQAFLDFSSPSIGGKLPNADFYLSDGK